MYVLVASSLRSLPVWWEYGSREWPFAFTFVFAFTFAFAFTFTNVLDAMRMRKLCASYHQASTSLLLNFPNVSYRDC